LAEVLSSSPSIALAQPRFPEPKFFLDSSKINKGKQYYKKLHFSKNKQARVFMEKSTSYLENPFVAESIKLWFPEAIVIVLVRNPVERAISNYFFSLANSLENRPIEEALAIVGDEPATPSWQTSVSPFAYVQRGYYARNLKEWKKHFPSSQLKILLFEKAVSSKEPVLSLFRDLTGKAGEQELRFPELPINRCAYNKNQLVSPNLRLKLKKIFCDSVLELDKDWNLDAAKHWGFIE